MGSPRTPMIAFNSVIVTCLARSTACATCCWCCGDRGARPGQSRARGHRDEPRPPPYHPSLEPVTPSFVYISLRRGAAARAHLPGVQGEPLAAFFRSTGSAQTPPRPSEAPRRVQFSPHRPPKGFATHTWDLSPVPHGAAPHTQNTGFGGAGPCPFVGHPERHSAAFLGNPPTPPQEKKHPPPGVGKRPYLL